MTNNDDDIEALPTLGWVEELQFTPLDNVTIQFFMDFLVRPWDDDFTDV